MKVIVDLDQLPDHAVVNLTRSPTNGVVVGVFIEGAELETHVCAEALAASGGDVTEDAQNVAKALQVPS